MSTRTYAPLPIYGYSPQTPDVIKVVNLHKQWEERALRHLDKMAADPNLDQRWLAIARTRLEEAFMAVNRAVLKPIRIALPEDE